MLIQNKPDAQQILFRSTQKKQTAAQLDSPVPQDKFDARARAWVQVPLAEVYKQHQKEGAEMITRGSLNPIRWLLGAGMSAPVTRLEASLSDRGLSGDKTAFQAVTSLKKERLKSWGMAALGVGLALAGVGALALGGIQLMAASGAGVMAMALGTALKSAGIAVGGLIGAAVGRSMFCDGLADSASLKDQVATVQRVAGDCAKSA